VCPASFDLGQHLNVTLLSVTEGDDKPAKYPLMFRAADAMLLTKTDLLAVLDDFDCDKAEAHLRNLANPAPVMRLSARKELDMETWYAWLREQLAAQRARVALGQSRRPAIQSDGQKLHSVTA
jgi:hydrogenase nickel incorporation protein HypB